MSDPSVDDRVKVEVEKQVSAVETRLKLWIVGNVCANLIAVGCVAIPAVYMLGQISQKFESIMKETQNSSDSIRRYQMWMAEREIWENQAEAWMVERGFKPPRYGRPGNGDE